MDATNADTLKKKCPFCAEEIQEAAIVCKHCGRDLPGGGAVPTKPTSPQHTAVGAIMTIALLAAIGASIARVLGVPAEQTGFVLLGAGAIAWAGAMWKLRGGLLIRFGGGFLIGVGVVLASMLTMNFCTGVWIGGVR